MLDVNALIVEIKKVGKTGVRIVPMEGQPHDGQQMIQVQHAGCGWVVLATGVPKSVAEDLVQKATNKLICG